MNNNKTFTNRIEVIDSLRGFALLGVLIANIPFVNEGVSKMDATLSFLFNLLIDRKFVTIFSILFGFGFYVQMKNAATKNSNFKKYFIVRMLLLFAIGSIHAFVIWNGDILRCYAVGGLFLFLCRNLSIKRTILFAVAFNVLLAGVIFILNAIFESNTNAANTALANSYFSYLHINAATDDWVNFISGMPLALVFTFGNMLIGVALGKINFFTASNKKLQKIFIGLGFSIGLVASFIYYKISSNEIEMSTSLMWLPFIVLLAIILQSLGYISLFIMLYQNIQWRKFLFFFNTVGRMALTNYIFQSVFYLLVIYHCITSFHLYGKINRAETYTIALLLFVGQRMLSNFLLKKFTQGPVEYVWRQLANTIAKKINFYFYIHTHFASRIKTFLNRTFQ
jgi:uncharacterized protein